VVDGEVVKIVNDAWPFVSAAIAGYGAAVLKVSEDAAANVTMSLGRRILQRVFGREQAPVALADLAADPEDADLQAALRVALRKLLTEDTQLVGNIRDMLSAAAAPQVVASNVVKDSAILGSVIQAGAITGDVTLGRELHQGLVRRIATPQSLDVQHFRHGGRRILMVQHRNDPWGTICGTVNGWTAHLGWMQQRDGRSQPSARSW
jgi:hypothetical protein